MAPRACLFSGTRSCGPGSVPREFPGGPRTSFVLQRQPAVMDSSPCASRGTQQAPACPRIPPEPAFTALPRQALCLPAPGLRKNDPVTRRRRKWEQEGSVGTACPTGTRDRDEKSAVTGAGSLQICSPLERELAARSSKAGETVQIRSHVVSTVQVEHHQVL